MDKNFISVDDLMRQRLGGGEERERSGAWLNMRELLDKEMPQQRRIGIFYWRRLFSVVAVLSLVGTLSVGSYESSAFNRGNIAGTVGQDFTAANQEPGNVYALGMNEAGRAERSKLAVRTSGHIDGITKHKQRHVVIANKIAGISEGSEKLNEANDVAIVDGSAKTTVSSKVTVTAIVDRPVTTTENANRRSVKSSNASGESNISATAEHHNATRKGNAGENGRSRASINKRMRAAGEATTNTTVPSGQTNVNKVAANGNTTLENSNSSTVEEPGTTNSVVAAGRNQTNEKGSQGNLGGAVSGEALAGKESEIGAKGAATTDEKMDKAVLNSSTPATTHGPSGSHKKMQASVPATGVGKKNSLNTSAVAENELKSKEAGTGVKHATGTTSVAATANDNSAPASKTTSGTVSSKSTSGAVLTTGGVAVKNTENESGSTTSDSKTMVENNAPNPDNNTQGKRVITKLVVHERNVKVAENEYALRIDTISMEKVNMDLGITPAAAVANNNVAPEVAGKKKKGRGRRHAAENAATASVSASSGSASGAGSTPGAATTGTRSNKQSSKLVASAGKTPAGKVMTGSSLSVSGNEASMAGEDEGRIAAGKSAGAEGETADMASVALNASGSEVKGKLDASKKHSGVSIIQKLSMAFNEVKQNASGTKFVAGIAAGINSNFFGPSSFKGFQFGLTGDIIFNSRWNIMAEMKYFHRLNNNTSIDDNFYTYTPVGSQYRKQLQLNSYSFSALHSLEMPVAVRYSKGSFNFYAGANFLYSFTINTGATTLPASTVAPEYVNEPGTDNKGVLTETDFKSRFGLGYLFGFSYKVAPNLDLDLRNVQTVWDNAATTGAKSISGQLYKTPSLQLSIMYRLGGHRSRD